MMDKMGGWVVDAIAMVSVYDSLMRGMTVSTVTVCMNAIIPLRIEEVGRQSKDDVRNARHLAIHLEIPVAESSAGDPR